MLLSVLTPVVAFAFSSSLASASTGIPVVSFSSSTGRLYLHDVSSIVVDKRYADSVDEKGQTLIPPTLQEFANTFASDLKERGFHVPVAVGDGSASASVFITLGDPTKYLDAAGRQSSEGYSLSVNASGVVIAGASPLGAWWGTRTLLQQTILYNGSVPYGSVTDTPGWGERGMMLDAGRHYYPPEFLMEMCAYMSFFKQNTFHLHLSDNLFINTGLYTRQRSLELYARFRLWSDDQAVAGLNKHKNESYTQDQFEKVQTACAARGVTILPEIEAPGHALVFVQWKPEIGLSPDLSLLNITHPETIPTMKAVWSTFLPWFHSKTVHIGADEYSGSADDYNTFVDAMADHIHTVSNKSMRIWGTFPPKAQYKQNIYQNVSIQHWEFNEDDPLNDYIHNHYSVVNSDDTYYVVNKWSSRYPPSVPYAHTFNGDPANNGPWYPYVFDTRNAGNNPKRNEPLVLGAIAPLWNDYGANASVVSEAYYAWREGIPALADKQWGSTLTAADFTGSFNALQPFIPGQNLERKIPSNGSTILEYRLNQSGVESAQAVGKLTDSSGNGYDGSTDCTLGANGAVSIDGCSISTPLSSKGRDYTLTLSLRVRELSNPTNATLIAGGDSTLMLTPGVSFFAGGEYYRLGSTLPLNRTVDLTIIGQGNRTFAKVDNGGQVEFQTLIGVNGNTFQPARIAIEAPLREIGGPSCGWKGEVSGLKLTNVA